MERTEGRPEIVIGLIDGPVANRHPDLAGSQIKGLASSTFQPVNSASVAHGTFIAGMFAAGRTAVVPGLCPQCTLLVIPVFDSTTDSDRMPIATAEQLAAGIVQAVDAGARLLNLSLTSDAQTDVERRAVTDALDYASARGAFAVAAAGNDTLVAGSVLTTHRNVVPVASCGHDGRPLHHTNLSRSIGVRGVLAPGEAISGLAANGSSTRAIAGTSPAAAFVTASFALLASEFPAARSADLRFALASTARGRGVRRSIVPPLLDAESAFAALRTQFRN